jgi:hypothetical protein
VASVIRFGGDPALARRRGAVALLLVIAIHLALWGWLGSSADWRRARDNPATSKAPVTLRLLPWREPARSKPTLDADATARSRSAPRPIGAPPRARIDATTTAAPAIGQQADAITAPSPPASQALPASQPPPLNLALPPDELRRARSRNPAVDDPRTNTVRTTPEQRMATTLDTRVIEEDLGDGRRRLRRGDDCVIVKPSRIGQLMPFNEAAARTPALVGACP